MKNFLAIAFALISFSAMAESIVVANPQFYVKKADNYQIFFPVSSVSVTYSSCSERNLTAKTEKKGNVVYVTIVDDNSYDCMGTEIARDYVVLVSTNATKEK